MMRHLTLVSLEALAGTATASAFSGRIPTLERVAASGLTLKIASMSAIDQGCQSLGPMTGGLVETPRNGRVGVQQGRNFPKFSTLNTRSRCNTGKLLATLVLYSPAAGFIGEDDFAIEVVGPLGQVGRARYHVSVR